MRNLERKGSATGSGKGARLGTGRVRNWEREGCATGSANGVGKWVESATGGRVPNLKRERCTTEAEEQTTTSFSVLAFDFSFHVLIKGFVGSLPFR